MLRLRSLHYCSCCCCYVLIAFWVSLHAEFLLHFFLPKIWMTVRDLFSQLDYIRTKLKNKDCNITCQRRFPPIPLKYAHLEHTVSTHMLKPHTRNLCSDFDVEILPGAFYLHAIKVQFQSRSRCFDVLNVM